MANENRIVAQNRKARHDFAIEEVFEAGIILKGSEVKSLRAGKASLVDCYATDVGDELVLINCYIPEYLQANQFNHDPRRQKKLLLNRKQINKLIGKVRTKGYTIVALSIYFNSRNLAKVEIGIAKGRKNYDKRQREKDLEWEREKGRVLRQEKDE